MNMPLEPVESVGRPQTRMDTGFDVLEQWAECATESDRQAVYQALFAMTDQSLFRTYRIVEDWMRLSEFFALVHDDLVVKFRVHCFDSFGIVYVGPRDQAPGLPRTRKSP